MEISAETMSLVQPLQALYRNNVYSMSVIGISQGKLKELLSNSAICLQQIGTVFQQHFSFKNDNNIRKTDEFVQNIKKSSSVGVINGKIIFNKSQNMISQILSLCQIMINNLVRWIDANSSNFSIRTSSMQKKKQGVNNNCDVSGNYRCIQCHQIFEAVKIKQIKQSLYKSKRPDFDFQEEFGFKKHSPFLRLQQDQKDQLNSNFWDNVALNQYQKQKHNLYPKANSYLNHWLEQQRLRQHKHIQIRKQANESKQGAISSPKVDIRMVDGLISTVVNLFKRELNKKQIKLRLKKLTQSLDIIQKQNNEQICETFVQKPQKKCQCFCQQSSKFEMLKEKKQIKSVTSKNLAISPQKPEHTNPSAKNQFVENMVNKIKHTNTNDIIKKQEDINLKKQNQNKKKTQTSAEAQLFGGFNNQKQAQIIKEEEDIGKIQTLKSIKKIMKEKTGRNSKSLTKSQNLQDFIPFQPLVVTQLQTKQSKRKNRTSEIIPKSSSKKQIKNSKFRQSVKQSLIETNFEPRKSMGVQCNILLSQPSSSNQFVSFKNEISNKNNSTKEDISSKQVEQASIYFKNSEGSKIIQDTNEKVVKNDYNYGKGHENKPKDDQRLSKQNDTSSIQRFSETFKQEKSKYLKHHKSRASILVNIRNNLPFLETKKGKRMFTEPQYSEKSIINLENKLKQKQLKLAQKEQNSRKLRPKIGKHNQIVSERINQTHEMDKKIEKLKKFLGTTKQLNKNTQFRGKPSKKCHLKMFGLSDLQLFGGVSESNTFDKAISKNRDKKIDQNIKEAASLIVSHLSQLWKFQAPIYEQIVSFLYHPLKSVEEKIAFKTQVCEKQLRTIVQSILLLHQKKCGGFDCKHVQGFKNKIML